MKSFFGLFGGEKKVGAKKKVTVDESVAPKGDSEIELNLIEQLKKNLRNIDLADNKKFIVHAKAIATIARDALNGEIGTFNSNVKIEADTRQKILTQSQNLRERLKELQENRNWFDRVIKAIDNKNLRSFSLEGFVKFLDKVSSAFGRDEDIKTLIQEAKNRKNRTEEKDLEAELKALEEGNPELRNPEDDSDKKIFELERQLEKNSELLDQENISAEDELEIIKSELVEEQNPARERIKQFAATIQAEKAFYYSSKEAAKYEVREASFKILFPDKKFNADKISCSNALKVVFDDEDEVEFTKIVGEVNESLNYHAPDLNFAKGVIEKISSEIFDLAVEKKLPILIKANPINSESKTSAVDGSNFKSRPPSPSRNPPNPIEKIIEKIAEDSMAEDSDEEQVEKSGENNKITEKNSEYVIELLLRRAKASSSPTRPRNRTRTLSDATRKTSPKRLPPLAPIAEENKSSTRTRDRKSFIENTNPSDNKIFVSRKTGASRDITPSTEEILESSPWLEEAVKAEIKREETNFEEFFKDGSTPKDKSVIEGAIDKFLSEGNSINSYDRTGQNLLHYAALLSSDDSVDIANFLIGKGIDINARSRNEEALTALMYADENNNEPFFTELLEKNFNNFFYDSQWNEKSYEEIVKTIEEFFENNPGFDLGSSDKNGKTILHHIVFLEQLKGDNLRKLLKIIFDKNAEEENLDVDAQDVSGNTALMHAAELGNADFFEFLVDREGVDVEIQNNEGETVLEIAKSSEIDESDKQKILEIIERQEINFEDLFYGSEGNEKSYEKIIKAIEGLLEDTETEFDAYDKNGKTLLHYAVALEGRVEVIDDDGEKSIKNSALIVTDYLLNDGKININVQDSEGYTVLMRAVESGNESLIEFLLDEDAEIKIKNNKTGEEVAIDDFAEGIAAKKEILELIKDHLSGTYDISEDDDEEKKEEKNVLDEESSLKEDDLNTEIDSAPKEEGRKSRQLGVVLDKGLKSYAPEKNISKKNATPFSPESSQGPILTEFHEENIEFFIVPEPDKEKEIQDDSDGENISVVDEAVEEQSKEYGDWWQNEENQFHGWNEIDEEVGTGNKDISIARVAKTTSFVGAIGERSPRYNFYQQEIFKNFPYFHQVRADGFCGVYSLLTGIFTKCLADENLRPIILENLRELGVGENLMKDLPKNPQEIFDLMNEKAVTLAQAICSSKKFKENFNPISGTFIFEGEQEKNSKTIEANWKDTRYIWIGGEEDSFEKTYLNYLRITAAAGEYDLRKTDAVHFDLGVEQLGSIFSEICKKTDLNFQIISIQEGLSQKRVIENDGYGNLSCGIRDFSGPDLEDAEKSIYLSNDDYPEPHLNLLYSTKEKVIEVNFGKDFYTEVNFENDEIDSFVEISDEKEVVLKTPSNDSDDYVVVDEEVNPKEEKAENIFDDPVIIPEIVAGPLVPPINGGEEEVEAEIKAKEELDIKAEEERKEEEKEEEKEEDVEAKEREEAERLRIEEVIKESKTYDSENLAETILDGARDYDYRLLNKILSSVQKYKEVDVGLAVWVEDGVDHQKILADSLKDFKETAKTKLLIPIKLDYKVDGEDKSRFVALYVRKKPPNIEKKDTDYRVSYIDPTGLGAAEDIPKYIQKLVATDLGVEIVPTINKIQKAKVDGSESFVDVANNHSGAFVSFLLSHLTISNIDKHAVINKNRIGIRSNGKYKNYRDHSDNYNSNSFGIVSREYGCKFLGLELPVVREAETEETSDRDKLEAERKAKEAADRAKEEAERKTREAEEAKQQAVLDIFNPSSGIKKTLEEIKEGIEEFLIKSGNHIDQKIVDFTLLTCAIHFLNDESAEKVVEFLLNEKGANVDTVFDDGYSPLILAVWQGKKRVVNLLVNKNANLDLNHSGRTALNIAEMIYGVSLEGSEKDDYKAIIKSLKSRDVKQPASIAYSDDIEIIDNEKIKLRLRKSSGTTKQVKQRAINNEEKRDDSLREEVTLTKKESMGVIKRIDPSKPEISINKEQFRKLAMAYYFSGKKDDKGNWQDHEIMSAGKDDITILGREVKKEGFEKLIKEVRKSPSNFCKVVSFASLIEEEQKNKIH